MAPIRAIWSQRRASQRREPNTVGTSSFVGNSPINVGRFTYGHGNVKILQWGEGAALTIGSFCSVASDVTVFLGGNHRLDWATTFPFGHIFIEELGGTEIKGHPTTKGDVVIGHDVWIGHSTTIMSGVSIGSGAVIAANSTVVKDVMPYEVVGGNPAKVIRSRFGKEITDLLLTLEWWNLPLDVIKVINKDLSVEPTVESLTSLIQKYKQQ